MAEELIRAFKGIWIPAEIWLSQDLTMTDKVIYAEIDSFCSNKKPCYAGNKHFAQLVGISENRVSHIIAKLVEMGYVHRDMTYREDGKTIDKRLLSTTRGYCYPQQGGIVADNKDTNTYTNTKDMGAKPQTSKRRKEFVPPTKEEVQNYVADMIAKGNLDYKTIDVDRFYNWYSVADWHMSNGKKVTRWKQCLVTWLKKNDPKPTEQQRPIVKSTLPDMTNEEAERLRREMYGES